LRETISLHITKKEERDKVESPLIITSTSLIRNQRHAKLKEIHWITYKKDDIVKFLTIRELTKQPDIVVDILPFVSLAIVSSLFISSVLYLYVFV
jgi:hypothetical protein